MGLCVTFLSPRRRNNGLVSLRVFISPAFFRLVCCRAAGSLSRQPLPWKWLRSALMTKVFQRTLPSGQETPCHLSLYLSLSLFSFPWTERSRQTFSILSLVARRSVPRVYTRIFSQRKRRGTRRVKNSRNNGWISRPSRASSVTGRAFPRRCCSPVEMMGRFPVAHLSPHYSPSEFGPGDTGGTAGRKFRGAGRGERLRTIGRAEWRAPEKTSRIRFTDARQPERKAIENGTGPSGKEREASGVDATKATPGKKNGNGHCFSLASTCYAAVSLFPAPGGPALELRRFRLSLRLIYARLAVASPSKANERGSARRVSIAGRRSRIPRKERRADRRDKVTDLSGDANFSARASRPIRSNGRVWGWGASSERRRCRGLVSFIVIVSLRRSPGRRSWLSSRSER